MYDWATLNSDILVFFGLGVFALLCGLYRAFLKKEEEDRKSWLIGGICMCIFFFGFGIADINAAKNPEIEVFTGEFIEKDSMGTGSNRRTYCFFHAHDGSSKLGFNAADIEYFLIPEKGKWYEIHYVANSNLQSVVDVIEVEPPEYIGNSEDNADIEIFVGEFIEKYSFGDSIEYGFDAHDGSKPEWFRDEEIEYLVIPEVGKWYEIKYIKKNNYKTVVEITETEGAE